MIIRIDEEKCIGCGSCSAVCPDYFEMDFDKGKAIIKKQPESIAKVKEAIEICPTQAIIKE